MWHHSVLGPIAGCLGKGYVFTSPEELPIIYLCEVYDLQLCAIDTLDALISVISRVIIDLFMGNANVALQFLTPLCTVPHCWALSSKEMINITRGVAYHSSLLNS